MIKRFLENKVCLITGGSRGIGRAITERFAGDGAIVYAGDIQWDEPDHWTCAVAEKYQTKVIPVLLDVTDREMVKKTLMGIHKQEGRIDCVVNNAAIISNQKLGMVLRENLEQMYRVNVFAVIEMIQTVSRLMARSGGGSIINMASVTGVIGSPGQVAYSSTKGAVITMTKSAAKELAPLHIRVNAVAPGIVKTERFEELYETDSDKIDVRIQKIGLGRLGTPEDVANACAFLASDRADYISGQILGVDGCAAI